jgi:hypothetical protein
VSQKHLSHHNLFFSNSNHPERHKEDLVKHTPRQLHLRSNETHNRVPHLKLNRAEPTRQAENIQFRTRTGKSSPDTREKRRRTGTFTPIWSSDTSAAFLAEAARNRARSDQRAAYGWAYHRSRSTEGVLTDEQERGGDEEQAEKKLRLRHGCSWGLFRGRGFWPNL